MNPKTRSIIELHISTIVLGMTALFSKFIQLPAYTIICIRSFITAAALACFIWWLRQSFLLRSKRDAGIFLLLGLLLAVHWVTYFHAMQISTVAVGVISMFTFPVMSALLEPFFSKEKWNIRELISASMIVIGIYFIVPAFTLSNQTTQGIAWGLFSALLFAIRNIITRHCIKDYKSSVLMYYQTLITGVVILPFTAWIIPSIDTDTWSKLVVMAVVFTAIPHTLFTRSLSHLNASTAGVIVSLQPLYSTIYAAFILGEIPSLYIWIGGTLVGSAVMLETFKKAKT